MPQSIYDNGGMIGVTLDFADTDTYGGIPGVPGNLTYVGGLTNAGIGTTSTIDAFDLTSLSPAIGDIVIASFATSASYTGDLTFRIQDDNVLYTELANLFSNDSEDTVLQVGYKVLSSLAAGDIEITIQGGTDSTRAAWAAAVHVWRGADTSTPIDVTTQTATFTNTGIPNPPAITPVTDNAVVIAVGAAGHNGGTDTFTSSDLSNFLTVAGNDTDDVSIGMGSFAWTSGAVDPAAFGWTQSDSGSFSAAAVTLAIRPYSVQAVTTRPELKEVLFDNFETFSGWTNVNSGTISQSSTRAFTGTYSAFRDTAGHGNGGYKLLSQPVSRPYRVELRLWTDDSIRGGANADRFGLLDSSLGGYGFRVFPTTIGVERYNNDYNTMTTLSTTAWTKPQLQWYRAIFEANADDTFTSTVYDESGNLVAFDTSAPDTTYTGEFDRVYVGGGYPYYIDNLSVTGTVTAPLNQKNSGIWSLSSVLESLEIPAVPSNTTLTYVSHLIDNSSTLSYSFSPNFPANGLAVISVHNELASTEGTTAAVPTQVTIDGITATKAVDASTSVTSASHTSIWYAEIPSGGTKNVVVQYSLAPVRMSLGSYLVQSYTSTTPIFTGSSTSPENPTSRTITTPILSSGVSVISAHTSGNVYTHTWSGGLTENYDEPIVANTGATGASLKTTVEESIMVTVTPDATPTQPTSMALAVWR